MPGLHLKYISQWNLKQHTPNFSYDNKNYKSIKEFIDLNLPTQEELNDNDLVIFCIEEMYGYRTGIFGYLTTFLSNAYMSANLPATSIFQHIYNYIHKTSITLKDIELSSFLVSLINRPIPFLNFGVWDNKKRVFNENFHKSVLKHINPNRSISNMVDIFSNLCSPFYDSGLSILSNKPSFTGGFERLQEATGYMKNYGFSWNYFKDNNNCKGIMVICINLSGETNLLVKENEYNQMINVVHSLREQYSVGVKFYETYLIGDLKMNLVQSGLLNLFKDFQIFNKKDTSYLLHNNNNSNCTFKKQPSSSSSVIYDDDFQPFLKYMFSEPNYKKRLFEQIFENCRNNSKKIRYEKVVSDEDKKTEKEEITPPDVIVNLETVSEECEDDPEMPELISDSDGDETLHNIILNPIDNYMKRPNESPISEKSDEEWTKV